MLQCFFNFSFSFDSLRLNCVCVYVCVLLVCIYFVCFLLHFWTVQLCIYNIVCVCIYAHSLVVHLYDGTRNIVLQISCFCVLHIFVLNRSFQYFICFIFPYIFFQFPFFSPAFLISLFLSLAFSLCLSTCLCCFMLAYFSVTLNFMVSVTYNSLAADTHFCPELFVKSQGTQNQCVRMRNQNRNGFTLHMAQ